MGFSIWFLGMGMFIVLKILYYLLLFNFIGLGWNEYIYFVMIDVIFICF